MFAWLYDLLVSFVYFVLGLFGIQRETEHTPLKESAEEQETNFALGLFGVPSNQPSSTSTGQDLVVETLPCHEDVV